MLEAISDLADFVKCHEPVFLYVLAKKNNAMRQQESKRLERFVENGTRRIAELDKLFETAFERNVLGKLEDERYERMVLSYEKEQKELTPTLVNSLIERIEVHNNDKSSGHCYVKVDIYFTAAGMINIPTEEEILAMMAEIRENPQEFRFVA